MARALDICERAGLDPEALIVQPFLVKRGERGRGRGVWSGRRESNPRMKLGKLPFCH